MIYFLAKRGGLWGIRMYLQIAGGRLAHPVKPVAYETLLGRMTRGYWWARAKELWWETSRGSFSPLHDGVWTAGSLAGRLLRWLRAPSTLPPGTYVFADIERLSPDDTVKATTVWRGLAASGRRVRLLNNPGRSMRRYELLRTLHERGVNAFNVYRLTEARWPERYPVFLRGENDHDGPRSALLQSREELIGALGTLDGTGPSREETIITEFCDTADARGIYRKYGAFIIGDSIVPKHLVFSRHWANQGPDLIDDDLLAEERAYIEENPHEATLRDICGLARIEYGKIDYGILDGRAQVWEIATNPTINAPKQQRHPARRALLERFDERVGDALTRLAAR